MKKGRKDPKALKETHTVSVAIACTYDAAYAFLSAPKNFPQWAGGLCSEIEKKDDQWIAITPEGRCKIEFTKKNAFGILDHTIMVGRTPVYVPMRLIANNNGCEVLLTLYRQDGMEQSRFAEDIGWVERDLEVLKDLLEQTAGEGDKDA
ncbi:MAG: hypothetical protein PW788_01610 [Micavibrio sp.]|nr:hypothetical protein [Micavibrio sp.]